MTFYDDNYTLSPIKNKMQDIGYILATDVEDDTHGNFRCAHIYGEFGHRSHNVTTPVRVDEAFDDIHEYHAFIDNLKQCNQTAKPCIFVGYNVGYDFVYYLDVMDEESILFSGTRFILGRLKNGVKVIDLFNHGGGKRLEDWIGYLNMGEKGIVKTEFDENMSFAELQDHCRNDTRATWELGEFLKQTYTDIGASFKSTTSATALDYYRRNFLPTQWSRKKKAALNDLERLAYYGGRTECFSRGVHKIVSYDINSTYVACMAENKFPNPAFARYWHDDTNFKGYWKNEEIQLVHCRVIAPKSRVMVLPWRTPEKKLIFPWGEFSGWWTSPELHEAEKYGYEIKKVYEHILYNNVDYQFKPYALKTYKERMKAAEEGNEGMKAVWKLLGNGLYGKLAQRNPTKSGMSFDTCREVDDGDQIDMFNYDGRKIYFYSSPQVEESAHSFPVISALITSYARLKLLKYLKRHEKTVAYCDTDSIKYDASDRQEKASGELGALKFEEDQSGWKCFLKPKMYGSADPFLNYPEDYDFLTPAEHGLNLTNVDLTGWKIKGMSRISHAYFNDTKMEIVGTGKRPARFRESVKRHLTPNEWSDYTKVLSIVDDKRQWNHKDSDPLYVFE